MLKEFKESNDRAVRKLLPSRPLIYVKLVAQYIHLFLFLICLHHVALGILVLRPGVEPAPPAVEMQNLNHQTTKEVLTSFLFNY